MNRLKSVLRRFPAGRYIEEVEEGIRQQYKRVEELSVDRDENQRLMVLIKENHISEKVLRLVMGNGHFL